MKSRRLEDFVLLLICGGAIVGNWMDIAPGWLMILLISVGALRQITRDGGVEKLRKELRK